MTPDLVRITVSAPGRGVDVALPGTVELAALLPSLVRHVGASIVDGGANGGWVLRRPDGGLLETHRTLDGQVSDGDTVHLVPARADWPEPDHDDLADAIALGMRRRVPPWDGRSTLAFGLAVFAAAFVTALYPIVTYRPGKLLPGLLALTLAAALTVFATVLARAFAEARAGTVLASVALPYAFVGGYLAAGGGLGRTAAGHVLLGSVALVAVSVTGSVALAGAGRLFVAGGVAGLLGVTGGLLALWSTGVKTAAVLVVLLVIGMISLPVLAMRIGRLPFPVVPQTAADLGASLLPDAARLRIAVIRSEQALSGLLVGAALVHVVVAPLLATGGVSATILLILAALLNLLRARTFAAVRHRLPLLAAGVSALLVLVVLTLRDLPPPDRLTWGVAGVVVAAGVVLAVTVGYSRRRPSPHLRRAAEVVDVTLILLMIPVGCSVLGLYGRVRGLAG